MRPDSIGRLTAFGGNMGILLRVFVYARMLGAEGMQRVAEFATLNANYLFKRLTEAGFEPAYGKRRVGHELIITLYREAKELGIGAVDFAKRLLDYRIPRPLVPECLLIEPTESETREKMDGFVDALVKSGRRRGNDRTWPGKRPTGYRSAAWTKCAPPGTWTWRGHPTQLGATRFRGLEKLLSRLRWGAFLTSTDTRFVCSAS